MIVSSTMHSPTTTTANGGSAAPSRSEMSMARAV